MEQGLNPSQKPGFFIRWRQLLFVILAVIIAGGVVIGSAAAYGAYYASRVYPGAHLGSIAIGGLTPAEVTVLTATVAERYNRDGLQLLVTGRPSAQAEGMIPRLVTIAVAKSAENPAVIEISPEVVGAQALALGRTGSLLRRLFEPLYILVSATRVRWEAGINERELEKRLRSALASGSDEPRNATLLVESVAPWRYSVVAERSGSSFEYAAIAREAARQVSLLSFKPIAVQAFDFTPTIKAADVESAAPLAERVVNLGNLTLVVSSTVVTPMSWVIIPSVFASWLEPRELPGQNGVVFGLRLSAVNDFLQTAIVPTLSREPVEPRFVRNGEKVVDFQPPRTGVTLDALAIVTRLDEEILRRGSGQGISTVEGVVSVVQPLTQLSALNDLGINDLVGVGTSTFRDSHTNRIKNIANAVGRLNGVLIAPGEEFSANHYAGPYTRENGFLPEQVIKGNEIKPEIGGGMCQIGTTLFRMAMQSGLDITERRNHSLVVGYYSDPVNGNPGTDATLYEPILDLKFRNDTGRYLLLTTEIDYKEQLLTFSLWGTPDGRAGWYTHPLVSRWIPAGKAQQFLVDTLPPGTTKCQNAFRGAVASFLYTRITPEGEKIERTFDSVYRPLPKICLVGKAPDDLVACPTGKKCAVTEAPTPLAPGVGDAPLVEPAPELPVPAPTE